MRWWPLASLSLSVAAPFIRQLRHRHAWRPPGGGDRAHERARVDGRGRGCHEGPLRAGRCIIPPCERGAYCRRSLKTGDSLSVPGWRQGLWEESRLYSQELRLAHTANMACADRVAAVNLEDAWRMCQGTTTVTSGPPRSPLVGHDERRRARPAPLDRSVPRWHARDQRVGLRWNPLIARNRQKPRISEASQLRRLHDSPPARNRIGSGAAVGPVEGVVALDR